MNNIVKTGLGFIFGAVCGGIVAYEISKRKFSERLETELAKAREMYHPVEKRKISIDPECKKESFVAEESDKEEKEKRAAEEKEYKNYSSFYKAESEETVVPESDIPKVPKPYVITPEDYGSMGYNEVSLTYYADGMLTEEGKKKRLSIKNTIGEENIKHFGEYSQDALYVRNEEKEIDYEVLKDERVYSDVFPNNTGDKKE